VPAPPAPAPTPGGPGGAGGVVDVDVPWSGQANEAEGRLLDRGVFKVIRP
jgi:hypothetical protein